jgi:hypothetical protein
LPEDRLDSIAGKYLLVVSKVVPKISERMNSAIAEGGGVESRECGEVVRER